MRTSKFSESEILAALVKIEKGIAISDICKKMGVTIATVYNWKKKYSNSNEDSGQVKSHSRLKELEEENLRLRQLVANLSLEKHDLTQLLNKK
jgi:putative transposase